MREKSLTLPRKNHCESCIVRGIEQDTWWRVGMRGAQMWRFIAVTFGFLAVVFYQLSGGANYAPKEGSRQHAALHAPNPVSASNLPRSESAPITTGQLKGQQGDAKLILASTGSEPVRKDRVRVVVKGQTNSSGNLATVAADPDKIARLVAAAAIKTKPEAKPALANQNATTTRAGQDLRKVSSARVNMRSGPGKDYGVIGKLTRGTEVEVTRDDGTGWVQLRVLDTGEEGWMADFLLVAAN